MYLHRGHTLHLHLLPTGDFAIQADKKAAAETKTARTLGLIAGGTGRASFSSFLVIMKPYHLSSSFCRHYAIVAADSWHHQKPKWLNDMQPAVCKPGWCSVRKGVVADLCVYCPFFGLLKVLNKWCSDRLNFLASIKWICLRFVCLPDWEGHSAEGWAGGDSGEASRSL